MKDFKERRGHKETKEQLRGSPLSKISTSEWRYRSQCKPEKEFFQNEQNLIFIEEEPGGRETEAAEGRGRSLEEQRSGRREGVGLAGQKMKDTPSSKTEDRDRVSQPKGERKSELSQRSALLP